MYSCLSNFLTLLYIVSTAKKTLPRTKAGQHGRVVATAEGRERMALP